MSGFLDFRYKEAKLNMIASEIRESLRIGRCFTPGNYELKKCAQHKSTGTVSVTGETFNFETKLNGLRDILSLMTLYDLYLQSQIKCKNLFYLNFSIFEKYLILILNFK